MAQPTQKKKRKNSAGWFTGYGLILLVCFFTIYNTLFVNAYHTDEAKQTATVASTDSKKEPQDSADNDENTEDSSSSTAVSAADKLSYTTYPNTGETVATVLLDAGHGGFDPGVTSSDGNMEKKINLQVALMVEAKLRQINPQIEVKMIRTDDNVTWADNDWDDLAYRTEQQTAQNADWFVSLHCNSFTDASVRGFCSFVNSADTVTSAYAQDLKENLETIGWSVPFSDGIRYDDALQVVSMSDIHSILIEMAFMTNPEDMSLLNDNAQLQAMADTIAITLSEYIMNNPDAPDYHSLKEQLAAEKEAAQTAQNAG